MEEKCINKYAALNPGHMVPVADPAMQRLATLDMMLKLLQEAVDGYLALLIERLWGLFNTAPRKAMAAATGAIRFDAHAS